MKAQQQEGMDRLVGRRVGRAGRLRGHGGFRQQSREGKDPQGHRLRCSRRRGRRPAQRRQQPVQVRDDRSGGRRAGGRVCRLLQDKQEAKLRQQMAGTGVDVVRSGDNITLDIPGGVTFAFNSADINAQFYPVLDKVAATLTEFDKTVIEVAGHTDSVGSADYNQQLSERRANSVAAYLASRGVSKVARGHGRRRQGSPDRVERDRRGSRAEPPRRDHHRAGHAGKRGQGQAGLAGSLLARSAGEASGRALSGR